MTIIYERPVSRAGSIAQTLSVFALTLVVVATLSHRFGPLDTPAFLVMLLIGAAIAGLAVLFGLAGLFALWSVGAKGGKASAFGILLALVPLFPPLAAVGPFLTLPAIRDITTDPVDPPPFIEDPAVDQSILPRQTPITQADRRAQAEAYPELSSRRYEGGIDRVLDAVRKVAADSRIAVTAESGVVESVPEIAGEAAKDATDPDDFAAVPDVIPVPEPRPALLPPTPIVGQEGDVVLQGVYRTLVMGFPTDIVIRLREEAETTLVDMRVTSRYGTHDLGAGNSLIRSTLAALDAELLGIAGE